MVIRGTVSFLVFACAVFGFYFETNFTAQAQEADKFIIDHDTTWTKEDTLVFDKEVFIDNNATLTIEAGANIYLNGGNLTVNWGNIVASGTHSEPITITSENEAMFSVVFMDYEEGYEGTIGKTSALRYVHIVRGGAYEDPDTCGTLGRGKSLFVDTAFAAGECAWGSPTLVYVSGRVGLEHASFIRNRYTDIALNAFFDDYNRSDFFSVTDSNFGTNAQFSAVHSYAYCADNVFSADECRQKVTLHNNWWGDASGPRFSGSSFESENHAGTGNAIEGDGVLTFRPFATEPFPETSETPACSENCFSNVLFLPGVEASRLYARDDPDCVAINCENQLWEPNRNDDVRKLYLDEHGKSSASYDIYTRDVLDEVDIAGQNIYKSFIERMDVLKNDDHLINDWAAVPYDWRLSLEDILQGGSVVGGGVSYIHPSATPHIESELRRLAASSRTGKVVIVAHSNGGLLAKALMHSLGDEETKQLVETVVLVGVPQVGTPAALGAMLHGYDQDLLGGLILSKPTARGLAENMPSAYTLLPSSTYFSSVDTPVITFDQSELSDWSDRYGHSLESWSDTRHFLADAYKRADAIEGDMSVPTELRQNLLEDAVNRHASLDEWKAPEGVRVVQVAGWGVPGTVSGLRYDTETKLWCEKEKCSDPTEIMRVEPTFTMDGDGTVVTPSALWMADAERYWVDLDAYNVFLVRHAEHANILEVPQVNDFVKDVVVKDSKATAVYSYFSNKEPSFKKNRMLYTLHSPLTLDLYDTQGRHTGANQNGCFEENIPGTYCYQFGEVKYIFSEAGEDLQLSLSGYDAGVFTLEVEEFHGDISLGKAAFKDMPTTDKTEASLIIDGGVDHLSDLVIDEDGDGKEDYRIHPRKGYAVTLDKESSPVIGSAAYAYHTEKNHKNKNAKKTHKNHSKKKYKKHKAPVAAPALVISHREPMVTPITNTAEEKQIEKSSWEYTEASVQGDSVEHNDVVESSYEPIVVTKKDQLAPIKEFLNELFNVIWRWWLMAKNTLIFFH